MSTPYKYKSSISEEEAYILSSAWIMASNDENSIMTYRSIKFRLQLPDSYDIKGLINSRGELFRRGVSERRLVQWKQQMLSRKDRPSWVKAIKDEAEQGRTIEALTIDDVFRSQFRPEEGAPKSSLEVIDWGLQHLDRLRKIRIEAREQNISRVQLWLVALIGIANIIITLLK